MAVFTTPAVGASDEVHSEQKNPLGMIAHGTDGSEWIYLTGVASCAVGYAVTYDEASVTTLLVANAKGPVAIAGAATVADKYGWFCILAPNGVTASVVADSADNAFLGRETTDGRLGDGRASGDQIYGIISRGATVAAGTATVQIFSHPFVDDTYGS
jgi:hypothetical protein